METKAAIQEQQYHFPYHHLTHERDGAFFLFEHLFWGLEHYSYITFVVDEILKQPFTSLLDVGCGEGRIICELEKKREAEFSGIDISVRAINFAKAFSRSGSFLVHDIIESPMSQLCDIVVSCEVIEHIPPEKVAIYISHIHKSIKAGGSLVITTPTTNIPVNSKHYQHFTEEMFVRLFKNKFEIEKVYFVNKINFISKIINRLLANRLYLSNSKSINKLLYGAYLKYCFMGTASTGSRIVVIAKKLN